MLLNTLISQKACHPGPQNNFFSLKSTLNLNTPKCNDFLFLIFLDWMLIMNKKIAFYDILI